MRQRYVRFPVALLMGGAATYGLNKTLLQQLLHKDLKEEKLDKYYELDLNADMMKKDLADLGISIQAAHFNIEETQQRINEEQSAKHERKV